jgi:hypothetical protein
MSRLDAMMNQYKTNSTSSKTTKKSNVFDENNYFGTFLEKGTNSAQKQIRIVEPVGENDSPFVEIHGHKKKVDGKWRTFICPKHEKGEKCPFCEAREILLAEGSQESRKEAIQFSAKKMYVAKVIDRMNPEHGIKFWRFNHHYKNAGTFDKINAANGTLPKGEDPTATENGRDMIISITRDGDKSVVTGINYNMTQTPLSEDLEQVKSWKESAAEKTWEGVYSIKPYEYLEIIVRGGVPMWEKNANGEGGNWIDKVEADAASKTPESAHDTELSMGVANANASETPAVPLDSVSGTVSPVLETATPVVVTPVVVTPVVATPVAVTPPVVEEEDDDLPF